MYTDMKLRTLSSARRIYANSNSVQVIVSFLAAMRVVNEVVMVSDTAVLVAADVVIICLPGSFNC